MNRYIISKGKIVSRKFGKKRSPEHNQTDEELRINMRRAVKNAHIPTGLEAKIWNLIKAQA